jgi:CHASE2 domain-containing sensor protein
MTTPEGNQRNVVVVAIDGRAQDEYGSWPWNRDLAADLLAATASGEPKVILADFDLSEDAYQDSAGFTAVLAGQLSWMKNVILPYDIALATYRSSKTNNPDHLFNYSLPVDNPLGLMNEDASLQVRKVFLPAEKLLEHDPYLGFNYTMPDEDRVLRHQPLVMNYEGYYYPSMSLLAAAIFLGVSPDDVRVIEKKAIHVGSQSVIPINNTSAGFIRHYPATAFKRYSAAEVLGNDFDFGAFKNKVVLVAVDDPSITEAFRTPIEEATPKYLVTAGVIENIINENLVDVKDERTGLNMILLFFLGAVCAFVRFGIGRKRQLLHDKFLQHGADDSLCRPGTDSVHGRRCHARVRLAGRRCREKQCQGNHTQSQTQERIFPGQGSADADLCCPRSRNRCRQQ